MTFCHLPDTQTPTRLGWRSPAHLEVSVYTANVIPASTTVHGYNYHLSSSYHMPAAEPSSWHSSFKSQNQKVAWFIILPALPKWKNSDLSQGPNLSACAPPHGSKLPLSRGPRGHGVMISKASFSSKLLSFHVCLVPYTEGARTSS